MTGVLARTGSGHGFADTPLRVARSAPDLDLAAAERAAAELLRALGVGRAEGMRDTPRRMVRAYAEPFTAPEFDLTTFPNDEGYGGATGTLRAAAQRRATRRCLAVCPRGRGRSRMGGRRPDPRRRHPRAPLPAGHLGPGGDVGAHGPPRRLARPRAQLTKEMDSRMPTAASQVEQKRAAAHRTVDLVSSGMGRSLRGRPRGNRRT